VRPRTRLRGHEGRVKGEFGKKARGQPHAGVQKKINFRRCAKETRKRGKSALPFITSNKERVPDHRKIQDGAFLVQDGEIPAQKPMRMMRGKRRGEKYLVGKKAQSGGPCPSGHTGEYYSKYRRRTRRSEFGWRGKKEGESR